MERPNGQHRGWTHRPLRQEEAGPGQVDAAPHTVWRSASSAWPWGRRPADWPETGAASMAGEVGETFPCTPDGPLYAFGNDDGLARTERQHGPCNVYDPLPDNAHDQDIHLPIRVEWDTVTGVEGEEVHVQILATIGPRALLCHGRLSAGDKVNHADTDFIHPPVSPPPRGLVCPCPGPLLVTRNEPHAQE